MALIAVSCPDGQSTKVIKAGTQPNGTPRYRCQTPACRRAIFQLVDVAHGRRPETQRQMVEMALNGSGIRDTARVLRISPVTVLKVLKKRGSTKPGQQRSVSHRYFRRHDGAGGAGRGSRSR